MGYHSEYLAYESEAAARGLLTNPPAAANDNSVGRTPHAFSDDYTAREFHQYIEWAVELIFWALHGYPRDRLARDLRWQAART